MALIPFAVALATSASVGAEAFLEPARVGVVVGEPLEVKTGPDASYGRAFSESLSPGVELLLTEERGGWVRGRLANGRAAWAPIDALRVVEIR